MYIWIDPPLILSAIALVMLDAFAFSFRDEQDCHICSDAIAGAAGP